MKVEKMAKTIRCSPDEGWNGLKRTLEEEDAEDEIEIVLEEGNYLATSCLTLRSGIRIVGNGKVTLTPIRLSRTTFLIQRVEKISLVGLCFSSIPAEECPDEGFFIDIDDARAVLVEDCVFNGYKNKSKALWVSHSSEITVRDCYVMGFTSVGISFESSVGIIDGNECWENGSNGISVRFDHKFTGPSNVQVCGNRCHDNIGPGIFFGSSNFDRAVPLSLIGSIVSNECWGNRSGITVLGFIDALSYVNIRGNLCYDNIESGITFQSSSGSIEDNECWGSKDGHGINVSVAGIDSFGRPSDVLVHANRCHDNVKFGINFESSKGAIAGNECWGNKQGNSSRTKNSPEVIERNNRTQSSVPVWLACNIDVTGASALADFMNSGGCPGCFKRFWNATSSVSDRTLFVSDSVLSKIIDANRLSVRDKQSGSDKPPDSWKTYSVTRSEGKIRTQGVKKFDALPQSHPQTQGDIPCLSALFHLFVENYEASVSSNNRAPLWAVAVVSAHDEKLDAWLKSRQAVVTGMFRGKQTSELKILGSWDMARGNSGDESTLLVNRFLEDKSLWRERFWVLARIVFSLIGIRYLMFFLVVGALAGPPLLIYKADSWNYLGSLFDARELVQFVGCKTREDWTGKGYLDKAIWLLSGFLGLLATIMVVWNRHLPGSLGLPLIRPMLEMFKKTFGVVAEVVSKITERRKGAGKDNDRSEGNFIERRKVVGNDNGSPEVLGKGINRLVECSAADRWCWLGDRVFGYKFFGIFGKRPDLVIVCLKNIDELYEEGANELRELARRCRPDQGLLLVSHMPGLAMLVNGYLDVWFPEEAGKGEKDTASEFLDKHHFLAYVLHDFESLTIPPVVTSEVKRTYSSVAKKALIEKNSAILGWHMRNQGVDVTPYANNIVKFPQWGIDDLLPILIMGSTPFTHMLYSRSNATIDEAIRKANENIKPYWQVFCEMNPPPAPPVPNVGQVELERVTNQAKYGNGLSGVYDEWEENIKLVGRQGYRVMLAQSLRELFAASSKNAESYLNKLLACGELYHLKEFSRLLAPNHSEDKLQRLPRHMEAALFLANERAQLDWHGKANCDILPKVVLEAWLDTWSILLKGHALEKVLAPYHPIRIGTAFLSAAELYHQRLSGEFETAIGQFAEILNNPPLRAPEESTSKLNSLWEFFLSDLRDTLGKFAGMAPTSARDVLESRLRQDWFCFPQALKQKMRDNVQNLQKHVFSAMCDEKTPEGLMKIVSQLRQQPALLTANLAILAVAHARNRAKQQNGNQDSLYQEMGKIADSVLKMRACADHAYSSAPFIGNACGVTPEAMGAASTLLLDGEYFKQMTDEFTHGADKETTLQTETNQLVGEIDGVALGYSGKLHAILVEREPVALCHRAAQLNP